MERSGTPGEQTRKTLQARDSGREADKEVAEPLFFSSDLLVAAAARFAG